MLLANILLQSAFEGKNCFKRLFCACAYINHYLQNYLDMLAHYNRRVVVPLVQPFLRVTWSPLQLVVVTMVVIVEDCREGQGMEEVWMAHWRIRMMIFVQDPLMLPLPLILLPHPPFTKTIPASIWGDLKVVKRMRTAWENQM